MYKGILSNTAIVANTDIAYTTDLNTNANTTPSGTDVAINTPGYYNVQASVTITGYTVSSPVTIQLYADDVAIPESIASVIGGEANTSAITLTTPVVPIRVTSAIASKANVSVRVSESATASAGIFTIEKVR